MKSRNLFRTYQTGCLIEEMMPLFGESLDEFEGNSVITTYALSLQPNAPWRKQIMEGWIIVSVCVWKNQGIIFRCILDSEGKTL